MPKTKERAASKRLKKETSKASGDTRRKKPASGPKPTVPKSPPLLTIATEKKRFEFQSFLDFTTAEARLAIADACGTATSQPQIDVRDLLSWPCENRLHLFALIRDFAGGAKVRLRADAGEAKDLFLVALDLITRAESPLDRSTAKGIAEEAAAYSPVDLDVAAAEICNRLKSAGIQGVAPQVVKKRIKDLMEASKAQAAGSDPDVLAGLFLSRLCKQANLEANQMPLRFFQEDFYLWNGKTWERLRDGEFDALLVQFLQTSSFAKVTRTLKANVRENLTALCLVQGWDTQRLPLWFETEDEPPVSSPFLAFQNGLVDFGAVVKSNKVVLRDEPDPRHFSTVVLPYAYDANAKCPQWHQVLQQILPNSDSGDRRSEVLQEAFGWCLLSGSLHLHLERFFIFCGNGANGKSTVLSMLESMLGKENVSHVGLDSFDSNFRLEAMSNKLANISFDMNRPEKTAEGILKTLVSGEPVQVDRKYKNPVSMYPTAKLLFATNELPSFGDRTDGLWRRAVIVPFVVQIPQSERDRGLLAKLRKELPGIFNWAVAGAKRLIENQDFTRCATCDAASEEHRRITDPFLDFCESCLIWDSSRQPKFHTDLYRAYSAFCERYLGTSKPVSRRRFERRLSEYVTDKRQNCPAIGPTAMYGLDPRWSTTLSVQ